MAFFIYNSIVFYTVKFIELCSGKSFESQYFCHMTQIIFFMTKFMIAVIIKICSGVIFLIQFVVYLDLHNIQKLNQGGKKHEKIGRFVSRDFFGGFFGRLRRWRR
jgi:hypothetical protein